jgi:hypothetical protein
VEREEGGLRPTGSGREPDGDGSETKDDEGHEVPSIRMDAEAWAAPKTPRVARKAKRPGVLPGPLVSCSLWL